MSVQVEETGPVERRLSIDVPTARVDAAFDAIYRTMGSQVRVRGFRPGHVPRSVLERMLGERARGEVLERLLRQTLPKAIEEAELAVIGEPRLTPGEEPKQGSPYSYEVTVEIRPEIELRKIRGLEVTRPELPEPEEDPVESYLGELRETHGQLVEEPEGTTAARGRVAIVDYEGTCDGEPFDGGAGRGAAIEIGSGRAIPGFEEQLEGMAAGGEREFDLELPPTGSALVSLGLEVPGAAASLRATDVVDTRQGGRSLDGFGKILRAELRQHRLDRSFPDVHRVSLSL